MGIGLRVWWCRAVHENGTVPHQSRTCTQPVACKVACRCVSGETTTTTGVCPRACPSVPYRRRMHARNADDFSCLVMLQITPTCTSPTYLPYYPPIATLDILRTCALIARRNRLLRKLAISDIRLLRVPTSCLLQPQGPAVRVLWRFLRTESCRLHTSSRPGQITRLYSQEYRLGRRSMMRRLWAIADIHLSFKSNREEFAKLQPRGIDDGLILAGDGAYRSSRGVAPHRS